ncbi:hypothetical protein [Flavobacterium sp. ABG]|uniref:hypothetical protein n=1 Tax=Flavobacterium sp. ABG TaxID=1423322 RepID=UPI000AAAE0F6|nr:hypothetical protein [Flavobacterium sp. ABG]
MKKLVYIICICFLIMSHKQNNNFENINFYYLGYESKTYLNNFVLLQFEIENLTNDTIYLSEKNIDLKIFKNKKKINEDNLPTYLPFIRPIKIKEFKCEEKERYEKSIEELKLKFANKLYEKNFSTNTIYKDSKDFILENIIRDCIVLMPNESIDYNKGFYSKKFDKNCKVSVKYSENKRFTYFVNDSGKRIDIND